MSSYKFNDNTLLHSCGFNLVSFVSIMKYGIMSHDYASKNNISFARNYKGSNLDDTISCIRYLYVNPSVVDGAYNIHAMKGISFIIEDVDFIYDKDERIIHRCDEVLVDNYIPVSKIVGILIPDNYLSCHLDQLEYIKNDATSYMLIKNNGESIKSFLNSSFSYDDYYRELYYINEAYNKESNEVEKEELKKEFSMVIDELNQLIGLDFERFFKEKLSKNDIVLSDVVQYLNNMYLKLPIYIVDSELKRKK